MPSAAIDPKTIATSEGRYAILEAEFPGEGVTSIGVLLQDPSADRLYVRLRRDFDEIAAEDVEVFEALESDLETKAAEVGAERLFASLEDTLSNTIRITDRESVMVVDFERTLNRLYARHVQATVRPGITHVPRWSLRAAAGRFLDNEEVESQGYVELPRGTRWKDDYFVVEIAGTSMEPLIPNGSFCLFRQFGGGSRQGKLVLVEELGRGGNDRYTVKRYTSTKRRLSNGAWEHGRIRLEPLNPEHQAWDLEEDQDRYRIVAEFVEVLY